MSDKLDQDPVSLLLTWLLRIAIELFLDNDDRPCVNLKDDPDRKVWHMRDEKGKPSERIKSYLRGQYRLATNKTKHLEDDHLKLTLDYLVDEAFKTGRKNIRAEVDRAGDYTFEAIVVFVGTLTPNSPCVTMDAKENTLVYRAKTNMLWAEINDHKIEVQVTADKKTLPKAINLFSRRVTELYEEYRKEGLDVTIGHKEDGSWVTIVRNDNLFHSGPVLVVPDDQPPSSSGKPSETNSISSKDLEKTDGTDIGID